MYFIDNFVLLYIKGPPAWGNFNQKWKLCTHGGRQSPIDILPTDLLYDSNLKHIFLSKHKVSKYLYMTEIIGYPLWEFTLIPSLKFTP